MIGRYFAAFAILGLLSGSAFAQDADPNTPIIDQRLNNQQERIDNGLAKGSLNTNQATRLQDRDASIAAQAQHDAGRDGTNNLTTKQRRHLRHRENKVSRSIHHDKVVDNKTTQ